MRRMGRRRTNYIFASEKERRSPAGCLFVLLALAAVLIMTGLLLNHAMNQRVELAQEKVSVMKLDKAFEGFTVLHLSDLHASALGADAALWKELLYGKKVSAVVLSGDMVGKTGNYQPMIALIMTLREALKDVPVYFIAGDEDPAPVISTPQGTAEPLAEWVRAACQVGGTFLDAPIAQQVGKRRVWFVPEYLYDVDAAGMIAGLTRQKETLEAEGRQYESEGGAAYRALCYRLDAMERTVQAQREMLSTDLQVAVNHAPLEASYIRTSLEWADREAVFNFRGISLILCGHYCGGQWRLPGKGAVYVPELGWFPDSAGIVGMQRVNSINQYISPGLGPRGDFMLKSRLFNAPSAALIKFTGNLQ